MEISVRQISIRPKYIRTLLANDIVLVSHLSAFDTKKLAERTKLSRDECDEILAVIKPKRPHYVMKASEFMIRPFERITTTIEKLDECLGGGIRQGEVTELSGEAGAGKSNLASQIGLMTMLPVEDKGLDGNVLMIHTEGEGKLKLTIKRYSVLAKSTVGNDEIIRNRLHVMNCSNEFELIEMINRLEATLDKQMNVRLIIIDSITCAFIQTEGVVDYKFYLKRSLRLTKLMKSLTQIAWERRIPIIVTNHVSYNAKLGETKPAMGKLWSHMCHTKIYLEKRDTYHGTNRYAHVTKGAINTPIIAQYQISDKIQS